MTNKVDVNQRTVVHRRSQGVCATFPDVCKTPTPAGPAPLPYPNVARSADAARGSKSVTAHGCPLMIEGSVFRVSVGDEAGSLGGVISGKIKGAAEFVNHAHDVKIEGKGVSRLGDPMRNNLGSTANTPPAPEVQPPSAPAATLADQPARLVAVQFIDLETFEAG